MLAVDLHVSQGVRFWAEQPTQYLESSQWCASQKIDGDRLMVVKHDGKVTLLNRQGAPSKHTLHPALHASFMRLDDGWWFDGELIDGHYHAFDIIATPKQLVTHMTPFLDRYIALDRLVKLWEPQGLTVLTHWFLTACKKDLVKRVQAANGEGIMFRHRDSIYVFGRAHDLVKWKFWKDLDVILFDIGRENKRSASMAVWQDDKLRNIGSVKLTDAQLTSVHTGQVAVIKYLYATEDGKLYQPSLLRLRDDKTHTECVFDQLQITSKAVLD